MAYKLKRKDATVQDALRRIAVEQIDKAIGDIDDETLDPHRVAHEARRCCKMLRGALRLVRPVFDQYKAENAELRDAARAVSFLRDSDMLIETYDGLVEAFEAQIERRAFASIRRRLTDRKEESAQGDAHREALARMRAILTRGRKRARRWRIGEDGFDAVQAGLAKSYRRAQKAMAAARKKPGAEKLHEWRKRVKYHGFHARLLQPIWPGPMKAHRNAAARLGDALGAHHDLSMFAQTLRDDPDEFGDANDIEVMLGLIDRRQTTLEARAHALGERLFAEPKSALTQRWRAYWVTWQEARPCKAMLAA